MSLPMGWMKKKRLRTPPPVRTPPRAPARRVTKAARRWAALDADFDEWLLGDGPPVATPPPPTLLPAPPAGALRPTALRPTVVRATLVRPTLVRATTVRPTAVAVKVVEAVDKALEPTDMVVAGDGAALGADEAEVID